MQSKHFYHAHNNIEIRYQPQTPINKQHFLLESQTVPMFFAPILVFFPLKLILLVHQPLPQAAFSSCVSPCKEPRSVDCHKVSEVCDILQVFLKHISDCITNVYYCKFFHTSLQTVSFSILLKVLSIVNLLTQVS